MAHSTRPVPSLQYFGSQADQLVHNAGSRFQNVFDRIRSALNFVGHALRATSYGLRQEVLLSAGSLTTALTPHLTSRSTSPKPTPGRSSPHAKGLSARQQRPSPMSFPLSLSPRKSDRHLDVLKAQSLGLSLTCSPLSHQTPPNKKRTTPAERLDRSLFTQLEMGIPLCRHSRCTLLESRMPRLPVG